MVYNYSTIGERIRNERKNKKMSQFELLNYLADKEVKIHRNTLSDIENGCKKGSFPLPVLTALSEIFGCEVGYLLGEYSCKTGRKTDIKAETGLEDDAINALGEMSQEDLLVVNTLIARGDITLIRYALQNYYRQSFKTITIRGLGEQSDMETAESNKVFQYLSNEFISDVFNSLVHEEEITNYFMRQAVGEFYDAMEEAVVENNSMYEQTPERKNFIDKVHHTLETKNQRNKESDYYAEFNKKI